MTDDITWLGLQAWWWPWSLGVAVLGWVLSLVARGSGRWGTVERVAWGLALAGLVVALAQPTRVVDRVEQHPGALAVVVDGSLSMATERRGGSAANEALSIVRALQREHPVVDVHSFSDTLSLGLPEAFDGPQTDMGGAFRALSERYAGQRLGGVVWISDGLGTGPVRAAFRADASATPPFIAAPLTVVEVGADSNEDDVAVLSASAGEFAYLRSPTQVVARVSAPARAGGTLPVTLEQDGAVVHSQQVMLDGDGQADVVFTVRPAVVGRNVYVVRVAANADDRVPANNVKTVVIDVVREQIRVLQVAGSPSWDVKFLRRLLKGDPGIDLVNFFILRTVDDDIYRFPNAKLALISFPYEQLFSTNIDDFDLVVLHNFDPRPYLGGRTDLLMARLADFVRGGGALAMVGGDHSFEAGGFDTSPLASVLPVRLQPQGTPVDARPFTPRLTDEGHSHPVTRLETSASDNEKRWAALPALEGTHVVSGPAPRAEVLLAHPDATTATGEPLPILAVADVDRGRSLALTVDATWRWSMSEAAAGRGNRAYLRFWKHAIRWLTRDPAMRRVTVDAPPGSVSPAGLARVVARVLAPDFAPLADASVTLEITTGGVTREMQGATGPDGLALFDVAVDAPGLHRVGVSATRDGRSIGEAESAFVADAAIAERLETGSDTDFLRWLAGSGRFVPSGGSVDIDVDVEASRTEVHRHVSHVWRGGWMVLWVGGWSGVAWWARRRGGLR